MTDKDPFAEPDDTERTVIRPNPGGRRKAVPVNNQKAVKIFLITISIESRK